MPLCVASPVAAAVAETPLPHASTSAALAVRPWLVASAGRPFRRIEHPSPQCRITRLGVECLHLVAFVVVIALPAEADSLPVAAGLDRTVPSFRMISRQPATAIARLRVNDSTRITRKELAVRSAFSAISSAEANQTLGSTKSRDSVHVDTAPASAPASHARTMPDPPVPPRSQPASRGLTSTGAEAGPSPLEAPVGTRVSDRIARPRKHPPRSRSA